MCLGHGMHALTFANQYNHFNFTGFSSLSYTYFAVENTVCILRTLSSWVEEEIDQEDDEDIWNCKWEPEQRCDMKGLSQSFSKKFLGCLPFSMPKKSKDKIPMDILNVHGIPIYRVDFVYQGNDYNEFGVRLCTHTSVHV